MLTLDIKNRVVLGIDHFKQVLLTVRSYFTLRKCLNISSCTRGVLDWILGKLSSLKGLSNIGIGCPVRWLSHHPWRHLKDMWMWCLGTWFSDGFGSVRITVRLDVIKGPLQPEWYYDSMIQ